LLGNFAPDLFPSNVILGTSVLFPMSVELDAILLEPGFLCWSFGPFMELRVEFNPGNFSIPVRIPLFPVIVEPFVHFSASSCPEFSLVS